MTPTFAVAILLLVPGEGQPDRPADEERFAELSAEQRLVHMMQEAAEYKLLQDSSTQSELILAKPVLRFNDNVTGVVDGVLVLWLFEGRPSAAASFWHRRDGLEAHEFQTLSETKVVAKIRGRTVWSPLTGGVNPQELEGVAEPADTPLGRLGQMRAVIRRFSAAVTARSNRRELRLLPQPLYRYGTKDSMVLDAAWFAFAKGTNPEVMVSVEARRGPDSRYAWHYSPVRMSSAACELKLDDIVVWTAEYTQRQLPHETYFNIYSRK